MTKLPLFAIALAAALLLGSSVHAGETATATFSMYCYWTGEATLGRVDGVLASRIGHWGGQEIVQVDYDPERTDLDELVSTLEKQRSFYSVVVPDAASKEELVEQLPGRDVKRARGEPDFIEPKHSLRTRYPKIHALDLTEAQAIALNSWSYFGGQMPDVLNEVQQEQARIAIADN